LKQPTEFAAVSAFKIVTKQVDSTEFAGNLLLCLCDILDCKIRRQIYAKDDFVRTPEHRFRLKPPRNPYKHRHCRAPSFIGNHKPSGVAFPMKSRNLTCAMF
jgi:hypothetical protein